VHFTATFTGFPYCVLCGFDMSAQDRNVTRRAK
jgi:hypothetical protein